MRYLVRVNPTEKYTSAILTYERVVSNQTPAAVQLNTASFLLSTRQGEAACWKTLDLLLSESQLVQLLER